MAQISDILLQVFPQNRLAQVSYTVSATNLDAQQSQTYGEVVELLGIDELPHEDGQNDVIATQNWKTTFDTSHVSFVNTREFNLPDGALDEDPGIFRPDEIRARVTLTPEPPGPVSKDSNLVQLAIVALP